MLCKQFPEGGRVMNLALRWSMWTSAACSARSYVKDGLIAMWDGIENSGFKSHSPSATVWHNLGSLGSSFDATSPSAIEFTDNAAVFNAVKCFSTPAGFMSGQIKGEWTVEAVFTPYSGSFANYHGVCGEHAVDANTNGLIGCQYGNQIFSVGVYRQGSQAGDRSMCHIPSSAFQAGEVSMVSVAASASELLFKVYVAGANATSKGATYAKLPSTGSDLTLTGT